jgi:hypothetical protein
MPKLKSGKRSFHDDVRRWMMDPLFKASYRRVMFDLYDGLYDRATVIYSRSRWDVMPEDMRSHREQIVEAMVGLGHV